MTRAARVPLAAGLAIAGLAIALLWPGVVTYDGAVQYGQALSGRYDDWHPPVMAALWSLMLRAGLPGSGPMLAVQLLLFWTGLGLIAGGLAAARAPIAAAATLAAGAFPILASWIGCVLKDAQLVGALVAAVGVAAWWRLAGRRLPLPAIVGIALLLGYAVLLRANAVFAVAPLTLGLVDWFGVCRPVPRAILLVIGIAIGIGAAGLIGHRLLGAERSHVERTLPLFDMAGIAHRANLPTLPGLPAAEWRHAEAIGCYTPFFWDRFGDARFCGPIATRLAFDRDADAPSIEREWLGMIAAHPLAWGAHRLAHLNDTLRIAVPANERSATAPAASLPDPNGLGAPLRLSSALLSRIAVATAKTPAGVPAVWLVLAAGLWWTFAGTRRQPPRDLGLALAVSASAMTASFAVVSIASDLRYHLWLMTATMLAAAMLGACRGIPLRRLALTVAATALACLASAALRGGTFPVAPIPA